MISVKHPIYMYLNFAVGTKAILAANAEAGIETSNVWEGIG